VEGRLEEIPSQVLDERRRGAFWECRVVFQADSAARERRIHLILYGNADAELPAYKTDLATSGEGFALEIENAWYKASLSRQMGQLERLTLKREHSLELFSGGQGHGEPPGIDWAHDYVPGGNFQKLRISLWETCPEFEVARGPVCTTIRRWGFPHSPVHPLFSPARLNIDIEYRFYAGLPWFLKLGTMEAIREFEAQALRDDEWVFSGHSFTDKLWMGPDGVLRDGDVPPQFNEQLHAVGFYNRQSRDAFIAMFLEHRADGLPELKHTGAPTLAYKWHGQLWSRGPLPVKRVPAGAILRERNAYLATELGSLADAAPVESLRRQWLQPLKVSSAPVPEAGLVTSQSSRLARPGEAGDSAIPKRLIWEALRDCKDAQLYTADASVVDLGLIYDVQVRGSAVHVVMAMPHRGRPLAGYFVHGSISVHPTKSVPIRERLLQVPGVRTVSVEQVWEPAWSSNFLTDAGRQKMGLSPAV
jgi:metal-sulfur cluster biosynthetic enzyme